jgi:molybdate transport system substrate-binding protein
MKLLFRLLTVLSISVAPAIGHAAPAAQMTIAAAADLHEAMDQVVAAYRRDHPATTINVVYGASGTLTTQIEQGAPFDLFFSADSDYPRQLIAHGDAGGQATPYAVGHLALWSASLDMHGVKLTDLAAPRFGRIAIANPEHAPYGKRAEQALRHAGVWDAVQPRLVYGENIAQAAQFASSGNAQVGIIALSLALRPEMNGSFAPVPDSAFDPLVQSFVLTRRGGDNDLARDFARYVQTPPARAILAHFGFTPPGGEL